MRRTRWAVPLAAMLAVAFVVVPASASKYENCVHSKYRATSSGDPAPSCTFVEAFADHFNATRPYRHSCERIVNHHCPYSASFAHGGGHTLHWSCTATYNPPARPGASNYWISRCSHDSQHLVWYEPGVGPGR